MAALAHVTPTTAADADADELFNLSNAAVDLVHKGKLDEAEQAARNLLERFPDAHDGWDRLGMVHEARGDPGQAADCYRKVIALIPAHPDDYDPGFEDIFHNLVARTRSARRKLTAALALHEVICPANITNRA